MMNTKITPLFDNILIQPQKAEERTASGIVLPDTAKEKPQVGLVKSVGKGKMDKNGKIIPVEVKVGDKVIYKKWGGNEIKVDGEEWVIVSQDDILGIIK